MAQGDAEVQRALDTWYKRANRRAPGEWGIAIADQTGRIIWSVAEDRPLLPASTVKLFTTGFARAQLGGDARLATRVVGTGTVDPFTGQWMGTWALELNGDLSLERASRQGPLLAELASSSPPVASRNCRARSWSAARSDPRMPSIPRCGLPDTGAGCSRLPSARSR